MGYKLIKGLRLSILLYALLHFYNFFFPDTFMETVQAVFGITMLILAGIYQGIRQFKLPLFLFTAGFIILTLNGSLSFDNVQGSLLKMSDIIGLLTVVPVIAWVLRQEPYIEDLIGLSHKLLDSSRKFYSVILSLTHILSYFLLFGVIPLMHQMTGDILKNRTGEAWKYFKGTALLRGFALSTLWVISIPSFAYAVEALEASLWKSVLQGFLVMLPALAMAIVFFSFEQKRYDTDFTAGIQEEIGAVLNNASEKREQIKKTVELVVLFITLFGTIFILYDLLSVSLMLLIPFVIVIWALIYFLIKRRTGLMWSEMKHYYVNGLATKGYQFSVMLSAGVIILALNQSGIGEKMIQSIYDLQEALPFVNMLYFLPFIVIILGFMGLGPLTVMVLVAGILESISLPYPPELIVLSITSGSALAILLSPVIMAVIILSDSNGLSPIKNGMKFNYKYAIALYILTQIYIQLRVALG